MPSSATENWSSPTLRSRESLNKDIGTSPDVHRTGADKDFSDVKLRKNILRNEPVGFPLLPFLTDDLLERATERLDILPLLDTAFWPSSTFRSMESLDVSTDPINQQNKNIILNIRSNQLGKDGLDGKDGKDGLDGKDGIDGKDGKDDIYGKDGKDDIDGKDGKDGIDDNNDISKLILHPQSNIILSSTHNL